MIALLSDAEVEAKLQELSDWSRDGDAIKLLKTFDGFPDAIAFVSKLVEPAEALGHHPDIFISYNKVMISLSTHDAGGLTQKDFDVAAQINLLES